MNTKGQDTAGIIIGIVLGLLAILLGGGILANRLHCSAWAIPENPLDVLGFFLTADMASFGTTESGCAAPVSTLIWLGVGLVVLILVGLVTSIIIRGWYRQSDWYLIRQLKFREGMTKPLELNRVMGKKKVLQKSKEVRPSLSKRARRDAQSSGFFRGTARGVNLYVSMEQSQLLLGPPRSGKGVGIIIGDIIDAPGPVITTSTRADNLAATIEMRRKPLPGQSQQRPVAIFDPQGISGQCTNVKWSPITGCENPLVANQRATSLISSAGLSPDSNNAEWAAPAIGIMECLLHAAALDGRSVDDLMVWGSNLPEAKDAVKILENHSKAAPGWAQNLKGVINEDPKMRGNKSFGVANAVKGLAVPNVREAMKPMSEAETFDIDSFLHQSGTLYILGTKTGGSSAGPFLIAMMDAITERARELAAQNTSNRLDPPLALILDEIANIADAWPGLITLMADGGGVGINPHPIFQSMAQIKQNWGADAAGALWEAANIVVQLRGSKDVENLRTIQDLADTYEHRRETKSRSKEGTSSSEQVEDRDVITKGELSRLPFGWGIILAPGARLIFAKLRLYFKRKDAKEIKAAKKAYYAAHNMVDDDEVTNPNRGQARGWRTDPGNQPQPIDQLTPEHQDSSETVSAPVTSTGEQVDSAAETPAQTAERLRESAAARDAQRQADQPTGLIWG